MFSDQNKCVVEKTGKTVDEAIAQAMSDFGSEADKAGKFDIEVLEQPNKGLFGFIGSKLARVRVTLVRIDPVEAAKEFLNNIFKTLALKVDIEISELEKRNEIAAKTLKNENYKGKSDEKNRKFISVCLRGNDLGVLIGKHGQTLDSLQYLTNIVANKDSQDKIKIVLDVEDYRKRREDTLRRLALKLADKVKQYREKISLEPMNSQERKIVHMALQNDSRIITYSEGEEPFRRVVISLKR